MSSVPDAVSKPPFARRLAPMVFLFFLSPICAEYLIGYAESTNRPLEMLGGLLILGPLYGSVALLIREIARRTGRGWPTVLLLAAAFGLIQAGLIDQSLFNPHYGTDRNIPYWDEERLPTMLDHLGISANLVVDFVGGHVIWSFAVPIAVAESCAPRIAGRPWLGRIGVLLMVTLYLASAALVLDDHFRITGFMTSKAQFVATVACALLLCIAAFLIPVRTVKHAGRVPAPWLIAVLMLGVFGWQTLSPPDWAGVSFSVSTGVVSGGLLVMWSRRTGWKNTHVLAVAAAALIANAMISFVVQPPGEPAPAVKYAVNATMLLAVLVLVALAFHRLRDAGVDGRRLPSLQGQAR